jgi:hypothetical protein
MGAGAWVAAPALAVAVVTSVVIAGMRDTGKDTITRVIRYGPLPCLALQAHRRGWISPQDATQPRRIPEAVSGMVGWSGTILVTERSAQ